MNILIADDHKLFCDALTYYMKREYPNCKITAVKDIYDAETFMGDSTNQNATDVILLDLMMPGMNGLQGLRRMIRLYPNISVILMSGAASQDDVRRAMDIGCAGFFPKTLSCQSLIDGLNLIKKGEEYIPVDLETGQILKSYEVNGKFSNRNEEDANPDIHERWMKFRESSSRERESMIARVREKETVNLTRREHDVMDCLIEGATNKDIADRLGIQTVTVKLHVRSICRKLDVKNRTQAALKARELKLDRST